MAAKDLLCYYIGLHVWGARMVNPAPLTLAMIMIDRLIDILQVVVALSSLLRISRLTLKSSDFSICWSDDVTTGAGLHRAMPRMSATRNDVNRAELAASTGSGLLGPSSWVVR